MHKYTNYVLILVFCLKADLRNSIQSCHLLSVPEPFMTWLATAFLTNSTYDATSEIRTGNLRIASLPLRYLDSVDIVVKLN